MGSKYCFGADGGILVSFSLFFGSLRTLVFFSAFKALGCCVEALNGGSPVSRSS